MVQLKVVGLQALRSKIRRLADAGPVTDALHRNLSDAWRSGADFFIRAAIKQVLVDTGMSAASFFPLARAIKKQRAEAAIDAHISAKIKRQSRPGIPTFPSGRRVSGRQNRAAGRKLGKKAFRISFGSPVRPVFAFSFSAIVFQLSVHEPNQQALETGIIAFEEIVRLRFIRDARFIIRQYLKTGRPPRGLLGTIE